MTGGVRPASAAGNPEARADVVRTRSAAARLNRPPLLILEVVEEQLDALGIGSGPVDADQLPGGHSNATFRVQREGCDVVLRRPPRPPARARFRWSRSRRK